MIDFTDKETVAISIWTSSSEEYSNIKGIFKKTYNGFDKNRYEKLANVLLELFVKYPDITNKHILYRGDILEKEASINMTDEDIYKYYLNKCQVGNKITLEKSILSFSYLMDVGEDSHKYSRKRRSKSTPSILYVLNKRKSKFIDISTYSDIEEEKEVLCNIGLEFIVQKLEEHPNNHLVCYINEA